MTKWLAWTREEGPQRAATLRAAFILFLIAVALYLPGVRWGLPPGDAPENINSWAIDELGPIRPLSMLYNVVAREGERGYLQYPLLHYLVIDAAYAPYLLYERATGKLSSPKAHYPFGLRDPVRSIQMLTVLARFVSVLMGAGIVVITFLMAQALWDRRAGIFAAVISMLMYSMFYYAKTSNVDVPALFWVCLVFLLFARTIRDGVLTARRAAWIGLFAALAVATKEQNYALMLLLPLAWFPFRLFTLTDKTRTDFRTQIRAPLALLAVFVPVYLLSSGVALLPHMFAWHVKFLTGGGRYFFKYPATLAGYAGLAWKCLDFTALNMSWPLLAASACGVALCAKRDRRKLVLLLPILSFFVGVLMQIRTTEIRYVMPWVVLLSCFAAAALSEALRSKMLAARGIALVLLLIGGGLALARGLDINRLMMHGGSRVDAAAWLDANIRPGQRIEFFGIKKEMTGRLPRIQNAAAYFPSETGTSPGEGAPHGDFVLAMGAADMVTHERCPAWVYEGLKDGSLGYELAIAIQTPTLFPQTHFPLNPRLEIYVRKNRAVFLPQQK